MTRSTGEYGEMRDVWHDYNARQNFEHELLNRKTTWLLTSQALLFAAYGITFDANNEAEELEAFRAVVAGTGVALSSVVLVGIVSVILSKYWSWKQYCNYFAKTKPPNQLPQPFTGDALEWGVDTKNTWRSLIPDGLIPAIVMGAWIVVLAL